MPGGSDTDVQYNQSGAFGGDSNLTWDYTTGQLAITPVSDYGLVGNAVPGDVLCAKFTGYGGAEIDLVDQRNSNQTWGLLTGGGLGHNYFSFFNRTTGIHGLNIFPDNSMSFGGRSDASFVVTIPASIGDAVIELTAVPGSNLGAVIQLTGGTSDTPVFWISSGIDTLNSFVIENVTTGTAQHIIHIDQDNTWQLLTGKAELGYSYQTPSTGFSITIPAAVVRLILDPSATLASGTVTMPAAPVDGQLISISTTQIITALTINGNAGQTMADAPSTLGVGGCVGFLYRVTNTTWYRVHN